MDFTGGSRCETWMRKVQEEKARGGWRGKSSGGGAAGVVGRYLQHHPPIEGGRAADEGV